jgi:hypothetical protein
MTSFFFVLRPSATFRDLPQLFATLVRDFGRDCAKVKSRIGLLCSAEQLHGPEENDFGGAVETQGEVFQVRPLWSFLPT